VATCPRPPCCVRRPSARARSRWGSRCRRGRRRPAPRSRESGSPRRRRRCRWEKRRRHQPTPRGSGRGTRSLLAAGGGRGTFSTHAPPPRGAPGGLVQAGLSVLPPAGLRGYDRNFCTVVRGNCRSAGRRKELLHPHRLGCSLRSDCVAGAELATATSECAVMHESMPQRLAVAETMQPGSVDPATRRRS